MFYDGEALPYGDNYWPVERFDCIPPETELPEPVDAPWDSAGCWLFNDGLGIRCYGRIGHLLVEIMPHCAVPEQHEFDPWPIEDLYGCIEDTPPVDNDVNEWRCSSGQGCFARYGAHWTRPYPTCYATVYLPEFGGFGEFEPKDGWSPFTCL
jgi:hypothetical protein